jgi:aminoglycoside phosphotransferase (APT) family kinase protein
VRCRLSDGRELHVVCKYGAGHSVNVYGHRGGVPYEVEVYRQVLQPLQAATPTFYGSYTDITTGKWLLVLDYVEQTISSRRPSPAAKPIAAARWIGRFHAATETRLASIAAPLLNTYDAAYYRGWVRRTSKFAGHLHQRFPWLATLCARWEDFVIPLLEPPSTVIHGEYYRDNMLYCDGSVYPVDWESAAIAAGEIDLACLTDRRSSDIVQQCELEYQRARWPHGTPAAFEQRLTAARLYMHFRWLGDRPEWTAHKRYWRFEPLRRAGEQLGLI